MSNTHSNWFLNILRWSFVVLIAFPFWTPLGAFLGIFTEWQTSMTELESCIFDYFKYPSLDASVLDQKYKKLPEILTK